MHAVYIAHDIVWSGVSQYTMTLSHSGMPSHSPKIIILPLIIFVWDRLALSYLMTGDKVSLLPVHTILSLWLQEREKADVSWTTMNCEKTWESE